MTVMAYKDDTSTQGALDTLYGNLLLLVWDLGAAVGIVCQRPLLKHHSPLCLTAYIYGVAAVLIAVFTPFEAHVASYWNLSSSAWGSVAYSAGFNLLHGCGVEACAPPMPQLLLPSSSLFHLY